jgi:hypothetical protein
MAFACECGRRPYLLSDAEVRWPVASADLDDEAAAVPKAAAAIRLDVDALPYMSVPNSNAAMGNDAWLPTPQQNVPSHQNLCASTNPIEQQHSP